jgi:hypothetical protein
MRRRRRKEGRVEERIRREEGTGVMRGQMFERLFENPWNPQTWGTGQPALILIDPLCRSDLIALSPVKEEVAPR